MYQHVPYSHFILPHFATTTIPLISCITRNFDIDVLSAALVFAVTSTGLSQYEEFSERTWREPYLDAERANALTGL